MPLLPPGIDRASFLDLFVERCDSLSVEWRSGSVTTRRGLRSGAAVRWSPRGGPVFLRSSDALTTERAASPGVLLRERGQKGEIGEHATDLESEPDLVAFLEESALGVEEAMRGSGETVEIEGKGDAYAQDIQVERAIGACADERRGVRFELTARAASGALLQRRAADRSLTALRSRVSPKDLGKDLGRSLLMQREMPVRPVGEFVLVFSGSECGALLHEIGHLLEERPGGARGPLGRTGDRVGPSGLTVVDDPRACSGRGSYALDDEGGRPSPVIMIEDGRLVGSIDHGRTRRSAETGGESKEDGIVESASGGHARRASYLDPPIPRMACTFLAAGSEDPAAILEDTMRGLFVRSLRSGRMDPMSGRITLIAMEGSMIEKGRVTRPISESLIVASARNLLDSIDAIGFDLGFDHGAGNCLKTDQQIPVMVGLPTIRTGVVRVLAP